MRSSISARFFSLLATGMMIAQPVLADTPAAQPRRLAQDVALQDGGVLAGQLVNAEGAARSGVAVTLVQQGKTVANCTTDADGRFSIPGLRAGVYQVRSPHGSAVYRLWAPRTAPPAAQQEVTLNASDVIRGQAADQQDVVRGQAPGIPTLVADTAIDDVLIWGAIFGGVGYGTYAAFDYNRAGPVGPSSGGGGR